MVLRLAQLGALVGVLATGCAHPRYTSVEPMALRPTAPADVTFDALARYAGTLGYVLERADPTQGIFLVRAHAPGPRPDAVRSGASYLVVEVADAEVRVSAIGRYVAADGRMHPRLAEELVVFGSAMRNAIDAFGGDASRAVPEVPSAYRLPPVRASELNEPSAVPPSAYSTPPAGAFGAR